MPSAPKFHGVLQKYQARIHIQKKILNQAYYTTWYFALSSKRHVSSKLLFHFDKGKRLTHSLNTYAVICT